MTKSAVDRYNMVAIILHWAMAFAIIGLWGVGHVIDLIPKGPGRTEVVMLHKAVGVIVLVLAVARLVWRLTRPRPSLPVTMPPFEQWLAHAGHAALYVLMLLIPIDGVLMSQSGGRPVSVFGLVLPVFVAKNEALRDIFKAGHEVLGWVLAVVLAGHVIAALRHHFVLKDDILRRMLPSRR